MSSIQLPNDVTEIQRMQEPSVHTDKRSGYSKVSQHDQKSIRSMPSVNKENEHQTENEVYRPVQKRNTLEMNRTWAPNKASLNASFDEVKHQNMDRTSESARHENKQRMTLQPRPRANNQMM